MLAVDIGPGIVVPLVLLAIVVPTVLVVVRRRLRQAAPEPTELPSATRLTSEALRRLERPWRVVPEIPVTALEGGVDHVLVGPAGVFAVTTTLEPFDGAFTAGPQATAAGALARLGLDDVLARVGASSTAHVTVHWASSDGSGWSTPAPAVVHVDGRRLLDWVASLDTEPPMLDARRVDELWRTVTVGVGRPDPAG